MYSECQANLSIKVVPYFKTKENKMNSEKSNKTGTFS